VEIQQRLLILEYIDIDVGCVPKNVSEHCYLVLNRSRANHIRIFENQPAFGSEGPSFDVPARFERRPPTLTASILDYAPHSPSELRYNLPFKPGLSLHPDSASPTRMWEWEELRTIFGKCLYRLRHRALPT
jgi:hypothetical protein